MGKLAIKKRELKAACEAVERFARSVGRDCQVIFTDDGVNVAPLAWSGEASGRTLYEALVDARESSDG